MFRFPNQPVSRRLFRTPKHIIFHFSYLYLHCFKQVVGP